MDGSNQKGLIQFLDYIDFTLNQLKGDDGNKALKILDIFMSKATGELLEFSYGLFSKEERLNWSQIKTKIISRFIDLEASQVARIELEKAAQFSSESACHFFERIEKLAHSAFLQNLNESQNLNKIVESLVRGLADISLAKKIYKEFKIGKIQN